LQTGSIDVGQFHLQTQASSHPQQRIRFSQKPAAIDRFSAVACMIASK
jgi:hypothetical protein